MTDKKQMPLWGKLFLIIFAFVFVGGVLIINYNPFAKNSLSQSPNLNGSQTQDMINDSEDYTPKYSGKISIVSATCADAVDAYGNKVYRIDVMGNANASVGAHLDVIINPLSGDPVNTCSSWSAPPNMYEYTCRRNENNPSNTTWTHVITDFGKRAVETNGYHVYINAYLWMIDESIAEGYHVLLDQADYDIVCVPVS
jgi:hypothetical protein